MKKDFYWFLCLMTTGALALTMICCAAPAKVKKQPLVVEEQECVLQHMVGFIPSHDIDVGFTVDAPIGGDKTVMDSIVHFLNEAVYHYMESGKKSGFTLEQVYCPDGKQLVKHYYDAYKPLIADTCYEMGDGPSCFCEPEYFSVTLLDQTDAFVTYEVGTLYLVEGALYFREWITFSQDDGRRIHDIITDDHLLRFYDEHPEVQNEARYMIEACIFNGESVKGASTYGLSGDSLVHQFRIPGDIYEAAYDLKVIKPYLTEEAKELLK